MTASPQDAQANNANTLPCFNPATNDLIRELPLPSVDDLETAVQSARLAFESWSRLTIKRRAQYLLKARDLLLDRQEQFIDTMAEETGKTRTECIAELLLLSESIGFFTQNAAEMLDDLSTQRLFDEFRGEPEADRSAIVAALVALSRLGAEETGLRQHDTPNFVQDSEYAICHRTAI